VQAGGVDAPDIVKNGRRKEKDAINEELLTLLEARRAGSELQGKERSNCKPLR